MLVLTRKIGQAIHLGENVVVSIQDVRGSQVRVGIEAPNEVKIYREEIYQEILDESKRALENTIVNSLPESPQESLLRFSSEIEEKIIDIKSGLIGFPNWTKFKIKKAKTPFYWINSTEKEELKFLLIPITNFKNKFYKNFDFDDNPNIGSEIFCLLTPKSNFLESTVNIKAPIVIDSKSSDSSNALQLIIDEDSVELKLTLAEILSIALT